MMMFESKSSLQGVESRGGLARVNELAESGIISNNILYFTSNSFRFMKTLHVDSSIYRL